jgi:hypothetical protein
MVAEPRPANRTRALQFILLLLILWDVVGVLTELSFSSGLFEFEADGDISGVLAARGSFSGAALVTLMIYFYGLVRGPMRHLNVFWVGALEQACIVLFGVYHTASGDMDVSGLIVPAAISGALFVFILINLPRGSHQAV